MIDQVFDSAMKKKSPLILNHLAIGDAIAEGMCSGPMGYYDCHGRSALESVITRDSTMGDDDDDDDDDENEETEAGAEAEETEPRDQPPPSFGSDPTPPSFGSESTPLPKHQKRPLFSLRNQRVETPASACEDFLLLPNGLLAKSRAETVSSFAMNMLEASKNKNFKNQSSNNSNSSSSSSPTSDKSKKKENQFLITVPMYTGNNKSETDVLPLAGAAAFVKTNKRTQKPKATGKTVILAKDDDDDNVIAAAAARWRAAKKAAKERYMVHPSVLAAALSGDCDYDTTTNIASTTTAAVDSPEEFDASTEEAKPTSTNQKQENVCEGDAAAENHDATSTQSNTEDDSPKHQSRKALDPPGVVSHKPESDIIGSDATRAASFEDDEEEDDEEEDDDNLLSEVVESLRRSVIEHSFPNNNNNNNNSYQLQNKNKNDPDGDLAPLVAKLTKDLRNVEDQHESHRSMLLQQRIRLQKLKSHRKEQ